MKRRAAKKNTSRKVQSVFSWHPCVGGLLFIGILFFGYMIYVDKNKALQDDIDGKKSELKELEEKCMREEARWNVKKSSENLEKSMAGHGMEMNLPESRQIIQMERDGRLVQGQHSVDWFLASRMQAEM